MIERRAHALAPLTAAALIATQVGSNALRDGLFLSSFPVSSLPYFMAGAAVLAVPAAHASGRLLTRFGPIRVVPGVLGTSALLFFAEWVLLGWLPRAASMLLYLHSSVLGAIRHLGVLVAPQRAIRRAFSQATDDPGGGGRDIRRPGRGALEPSAPPRCCRKVRCSSSSPWWPAPASPGASALGQGAPPRRARAAAPEETGAWNHIRHQPLLRNLALVITLAAVVAALVDYLLKAEAVQ